MKYHPSQTSEPVIVVYGKEPCYKYAVSESFVKACFEGEFGGTKESMRKLVSMIAEVMDPYLFIII